MKPKKYAEKVDLSSIKFEEALKALLQIKPPEKEKKPAEPKSTDPKPS